MKNVFLLIGLGIILVACDQSIESRLQKNSTENVANLENSEEKQQKPAENISEPVKEEFSQEVENTQANVPKDAALADTVKPSEEVKKEDKAIEVVQENVNTDALSKSEPQESAKEAVKVEVEEKALPVKSVVKSEAKRSEKQAVKKSNEQPALSNKKDGGNKASAKVDKTDKATKTTPLEANIATKNSKPNERKVEKQSVEKRTNLAATKEVKETKPTVRNPKSDHNDGTYDENGNLISNFTPEELRVGAQRSLTKNEIQYYKSLCRYAYMSDQDVIDNHCEAKKISFTKKTY
nr:hypothetical protein [uncultured Haemophilus sp.]